jgi:hypothetical protein
MQRWFWSLSVAMGVMVGATGCNKLKELAEKGKQAAEANEGATSDVNAASPEDQKDLAMRQKLNEYIDCLNGASGEVFKSRSRYLSWVDAEKGPTGSERIVYGLFKVNDSTAQRCKKALEKAKGLEPPMPDMEKAAVEYAAKLDAVVPKVNEAHTYYRTKRYTSDDFAQGRKLHEPLVKAFEAFDKADSALRSSMTKYKDGMAERELSRIEKASGKNLAYHAKSMLLVAKTLVRTGAPQGEDPPKPETLEKAINDYAAAVDAMDKYAQGHADEVRTLGSYPIFLNDCRDFEKSARAMLAFAKGKEYSTGEKMHTSNGNGGLVEGHPDHLVKAFNSVIQRSNSMRW